MKKLFYDLETTGLKPHKHSIHQIAGILEIDGKVVDRFDIRTKPHPQAEISPEALKTCNITSEDLMLYPDMGDAYSELIAFLSKHIDRFNVDDKAFLIGYNNRSFDDNFLYAWFNQLGDQYLGSWFNFGIDTLTLARQYFMNRKGPHNFKLETVADYMGFPVVSDKAHNAAYDVEMTKHIYDSILMG